MSSRKIQLSSRSCTSSDSSYFTPKRRPVQRKTVEKWIAEQDKELNTSVWLKFEMADREHVSLLKCSVCSLFSKKLESMRNFRPAFINGSPNIHGSSVILSQTCILICSRSSSHLMLWTIHLLPGVLLSPQWIKLL